GELCANASPSTAPSGAQSKFRGGDVRIAVLDPFSGISGDMTVGALLHLGLPLAHIRDAIETLGLRDVEIATEPIARSGIAATKFHVRIRAPRHVHAHRPYADIRTLLGASLLPAPVKDTALRIFRRLAEPAGRLHGGGAAAVQFHEAGAPPRLLRL